MRGRLRGVAAACVVVFFANAAHAIFLDEKRRFDVRLRAYNQWAILTESSERDKCDPSTDPTATGCVRPPEYSAGDLAQIRTFYNPEFDAKLGDFTGWMGEVPGLSFFEPEDFRFRFAWWGFYDAVYDEEWFDTQWDDNARKLKARFSRSDDPKRESYFFNDERKDVRDVYAHRNRINEMYLDYTKGRVFVRAGRQAISWGESDTIAIIDNQNPFDLTLGAPGFFQDLDESRIPLWTLRSTVKLLDNWKWFSSTFLDAYIVPGIIDTTVPINPMTGGVSAFGPDVPDPALLVPDQMVPLPGGGLARVHPISVDRLPRNTWGNSRWGVRLTSVVDRDYTVQAFFYRTFNQAPVPILVTPGGAERAVNQALNPNGPGTYRGAVVDDRGRRVRCNNGRVVGGTRPCGRAVPAINILERKIYSVAAIGASWYAQPLRGVIRTQFNYFLDEPAFIPTENLNPQSQLPRSVFPNRPSTSLPRADYARFVLGYDTFFFFRPLNPTNSFVLVSAFTGSYNLSEDDDTDYRNPQAKPGRPQTRARPSDNPLLAATGEPFIDPKDYEDAYQFEGFLQTAIQTDYMHGKLSPRFVVIADVSGIFAFSTGINYRFTDNLIGTVNYLAIAASRKASIGTFRAHDMVQLKLTVQLN